ncbi:MAG: diaminopimelate decarboxylase [Myxococcaceae bacterium]|nr:diaminopimelate decarboxylase [Myxococcaceae bacterium]
MNHFESRRGALWCEGVPLSRIAQAVGTPAYVYSSATLERHYAVLSQAFHGIDHHLCYSVKACSTLAVLKLFARQGAWFDIVSGGELERVSRAGADPARVVFAGVGKTRDEMALALRRGIALFNVESAEELQALDEVARRLKRKAPFALRVNPEVDARTHRYIATGLKTSKFGVPLKEARSLYAHSRTLRGLTAVGIDSHIGSQLTDERPMREAVTAVAAMYRDLRAAGFPLRYLDVGGGLGITYRAERPPSVERYAQVVSAPLRGLGATLLVEPGRMLVGNAAVLLTRVLYRKRTPAKRFVVVDAAMNDLMRPALYEAYHGIEAVAPRAGARQKVDVAGPVCESADVLGKDRLLPPLEQGDLVVVRTAGAYAMSMASNYNSRPRAPEVLVRGSKFRVVRQRETVNDLMRGETT